jgi:Icc-related predicted phosphoesterase
MIMLKINFMSDLHNEFSGYKWQIPSTDCDIIILAGDIGVGLRTYEWMIRESERLQKPIIAVMGNHEFYNHEYYNLIEEAKKYVEGTGVHLLERDVIEIDKYQIFGTTLWTDFNLYGPAMQQLAMGTAADFMSDYTRITCGDRALTPADTLRFHEESLAWLNRVIRTTDKKIVVTHHAPTFHAGHPQYRGDMCTPAFCSDLEGFIFETKPLIWISGHSHYVYQKIIDETLCVSNTRGYPSEGILHFDPTRIIEV